MGISSPGNCPDSTTSHGKNHNSLYFSFSFFSKFLVGLCLSVLGRARRNGHLCLKGIDSRSKSEVRDLQSKLAKRPARLAQRPEQDAEPFRRARFMTGGGYRDSLLPETLESSFSAVSKPNFASNYSLESSRRDLHNALLCTILESTIENWRKKNLAKTTPKKVKMRGH